MGGVNQDRARIRRIDHASTAPNNRASPLCRGNTDESRPRVTRLSSSPPSSEGVSPAARNRSFFSFFSFFSLLYGNESSGCDLRRRIKPPPPRLNLHFSSASLWIARESGWRFIQTLGEGFMERLDRSNLCCVVQREVRLGMDERSSSVFFFFFDTVLQVFFVFFLSLNQKKIFLCKCYNVFVIVNLG